MKIITEQAICLKNPKTVRGRWFCDYLV
jgi:hypothetical protein